jgi:hypothetical protein
MSNAVQSDADNTNPLITGIETAILCLSIGVFALASSFGWPERGDDFMSAVALKSHAKSLVLAGVVLLALGFYVRWLQRRVRRLERRLAHLETWAKGG